MKLIKENTILHLYKLYTGPKTPLFQLYYLRKDIKLAYKVMPKVACTAIKASMNKNFEEEFKQIHENPHNNIKQYTKAENLNSDTYVFTFVRNPFDRLLSCYKAFQEDQLGPCESILSSNNQHLRNNSSFARFIVKILIIPQNRMDQHIQSQYKIINAQNDIVNIDYVGKFENLTSDYKRILEKYDILPLKKLNSTKRTKNDLLTHYTVTTARLVYWKYRKDVKELGYYDWYKSFIKKLKQGRS